MGNLDPVPGQPAVAFPDLLATAGNEAGWRSRARRMAPLLPRRPANGDLDLPAGVMRRARLLPDTWSSPACPTRSLASSPTPNDLAWRQARLEEFQFPRPGDRLTPLAGRELTVDRSQMGLHRVDRNAQFAGDLGGGHARRQEAKDRPLPVGEATTGSEADRTRRGQPSTAASLRRRGTGHCAATEGWRWSIAAKASVQRTTGHRMSPSATWRARMSISRARPWSSSEWAMRAAHMSPSTIWYRPMCGLVDVSRARMPRAAWRDSPSVSWAWARVVATR